MLSYSAVLLSLLAGWGSANTLSGSFDIVTYNIAGLPEPLSGSNPDVNTPVISGRLGNFSIVHVQEDFAYHDLLLKGDKHPHRTTTSGNVPVGSGLNTLSNFPFSDFKRETWNACWFGSGDCLTPKGFTAMRVQIAPGVLIDFYNLHAEAGDEDLDFTARQIGFQQMSNFIGAYSTGNAVIIAGDTNTRYTSAKDPTRLFAEKNGMTDVWLRLEKGGVAPTAGTPSIECPFPVAAGKENNKCELIDKIHYRSSRVLKLTPTKFVNHNSAFLKSDGGPLSDHMPIQALFDWEFAPALRTGPEIIGGTQNSYWNDIAQYSGAWGDRAANSVITAITLRGGSRLDGIRYTISDGRNVKRGGNGGNEVKLPLASGENINKVEACVGTRSDKKKSIFYMYVETNKGRTAKVGSPTGDCKIWTPPKDGGNWTLVGFQGRSGSEMDAVGVVWGLARADGYKSPLTSSGQPTFAFSSSSLTTLAMALTAVAIAAAII